MSFLQNIKLAIPWKTSTVIPIIVAYIIHCVKLSGENSIMLEAMTEITDETVNSNTFLIDDTISIFVMFFEQ